MQICSLISIFSAGPYKVICYFAAIALSRDVIEGIEEMSTLLAEAGPSLS